MSAKKEVDVSELLAARFFGPDFFEQKKIIDETILCRSLSDFRKLSIDFDSATIAEIYLSASLCDAQSGKLNQERLKEIFDNLKAVRGNSAAIFL